jgi:hypothetical protein
MAAGGIENRPHVENPRASTQMEASSPITTVREGSRKNLTYYGLTDAMIGFCDRSCLQ